jgi:hypothetical protein
MTCKYFQETWEQPQQAFFEARENSKFSLIQKLPEDNAPRAIMNYMLSDDNIRDIIRLRDNLSAYVNDGISYKTVKAAGPQE